MEYCPVDTKTVAGQHCVKHIFSFIDFQWNFAQLTQKQWQTTTLWNIFLLHGTAACLLGLDIEARSRSRRSRNLNWRSLQRPRQEWASWGPAKGKQKKKSRKEIKEWKETWKNLFVTAAPHPLVLCRHAGTADSGSKDSAWSACVVPLASVWPAARSEEHWAVVVIMHRGGERPAEKSMCVVFLCSGSCSQASETETVCSSNLDPACTAGACKRFQSLYQKCRWQVTSKQTCILRMWLEIKTMWTGGWLYGIHRTCAETAAVSCGTSHVTTKQCWTVDIQNGTV